MKSKRWKRNISNGLKLSYDSDCEYKKAKKSKLADKNSNKPAKPTIDNNNITEEYATMMKVRKIMDDIRAGKNVVFRSAEEKQKLLGAVKSLEEYLNALNNMINSLEYYYIERQEGEEPFLFILKKKKKKKILKKNYQILAILMMFSMILKWPIKIQNEIIVKIIMY